MLMHLRPLFKIISTVLVVLVIHVDQLKSQEVYTLFTKDNGSFLHSENYNKLISEENLKEGDLLIIGESTFRYKAHLGQGSASLILKVERLEQEEDSVEYALRLPLNDGFYDQDQEYPMRKIIDLTIEGYSDLEKENIRIPKIIQSEKETFVLQKLENIKTSFPIFMQRPKDIGNEKILKEMEDAFIRFAETTYGFEQIGDFQASQLVYDGLQKEWILLDWRSNHIKNMAGESDKTILDSPLFDKSIKVLYMENGEMLNVYGFPAVWKLKDREIKLLDHARNAILLKRKSCQKILNQDL